MTHLFVMEKRLSLHNTKGFTFKRLAFRKTTEYYPVAIAEIEPLVVPPRMNHIVCKSAGNAVRL